MAWRHLAILVLVTMVPQSLACSPKADLPLTIYLDDRFNREQEKIFRERLNEANQVFGQELLGLPAIFIYGGRHRDRNGFNSDVFRDDKHVVYAVTDPKDPSYLEFLRARDQPGLHSNAYTTGEDCVIWTFHVESSSHLAHLFSHEPMHLLYLGHTKDPESVMYSDPIRSARAIHYNDSDRKLFCSVYECKRRF